MLCLPLWARASDVQMRITRSVVLGAVAFAALAMAFEPAAAENFLQRLFGFGRAREREPDARPMQPTYRFGYGGEVYEDQRPYDDRGWPEDNASYRTLCVRTCDGFYFPIGDGVRRERLYADARACTQRCDGEARLFYYPTNGGSVETMVDMTGKPYASLPTAFLYRKTLVEGCTCKPAPWSAEAAARHQGYAAEAHEQQTAERESASRVYAETNEGAPVPSEEAQDEVGAGQRGAYSAWSQTRWDRYRRY